MKPAIRRALTRNAAAMLYAAWMSWRLREQGSPWDWAIRKRRIGQGASPLSQTREIGYDGSVMPWCREPTESAVDPEVQITVLWWASALGKTDGVVTNVIGYKIDESPTNIMSVFPIEAQRDKYSRDVIQAGLIDATPAVRSKVVERLSRIAGNTISYKKFPGGSLNMVAAGSVSSFRGPRVGCIHFGEVDAMPGTVGVEGDPILLGLKRCEGFEHAIKIIEGTGTLTPTIDRNGNKVYRSRIHFWYEQSDQRKWFCPCRRCGHPQVLMWDGIRFPKGHPERGVYCCVKCDADHNDEQRIQIVRDGLWKPTAAFDGIRGYWANGLISVLPSEKGYRNKIHQFIVDAQRAERGMDPQYSKRVWINTFLTELDDPQGETEPPPDWKALFDRREDYSTDTKIILPQDVLVLTAAADLHKDRIEVLWEGWGHNEENWEIDHLVLPGEIEDPAIWKDLERELGRTFEHESGLHLPLTFAFVDAGKWPGWVYTFLRHLAQTQSSVRGRVRASRGSSIYPHPVVDMRFVQLAKNLKGHWIGTDAAKDLIYTRLRLPAPSGNEEFPTGYTHFPRRLKERFFEQLTSEKVQIEYQRGEERRRYRNPERLRNESLDLKVYNLAAFRLKNPNLILLEKEMKKKLELLKTGKTEEPKVKPRPRKSRLLRGIRSGW